MYISHFTQPTIPPVIHHLQTQKNGLEPVRVQSHGWTYLVTGNTLLRDSQLKTIFLRAKDPKSAIQALNIAYHKAGYFLVAIKASIKRHNVSVQIIQGQITQEQIYGNLTPFFSNLRYRQGLQEDDVICDAVLANAFSQRNGSQIGRAHV